MRGSRESGRESSMPIYEYRCENCGHEMEAIQKLSDTPLVTCPACENDSLRKKISATHFRLKGGGWYETDFKSGSKRNVSSGDNSPVDKPADKKEVKSGDSSGSSDSSSKNKTGDKSSSSKSESNAASSD